MRLLPRSGGTTLRCPVCGWGFAGKADLQRHVSAHHGDVELASGSVSAIAAEPAGSEPPALSKAGVSRTRLWISYLAAFLLPIGGLLAGVLLLRKRATAHGIAVLLISGALLGAALINLHDSGQTSVPSSTQGSADRQAKQMIDCLQGAPIRESTNRTVHRCLNTRH